MVFGKAMRSSNHQYLGGSSEGDEKVMMGVEGGEGKEPGERREIKMRQVIQI